MSLVNVGPVLSVGRPGQALTNSTAADQDYTAIYTLPANIIKANTVIRVTLNFLSVTGVSAVTRVNYLKLGSTKIYIDGNATNMGDSLTRCVGAMFLIVGTAAAGASVAVEVGAPNVTVNIGGAGQNSVSQPVAGIATNGTLAITPGLTFSGTGSTETVTLLSYLVELVNP